MQPLELRADSPERFREAFALEDRAAKLAGVRLPSPGTPRFLPSRALRDTVKGALRQDEAAARWAEADRLLREADHIFWGAAVAWDRLTYRMAGGDPDLQSEIRTAFYQAALRFNPDAGAQFSSFAMWWGKARLNRVRDSLHCVVQLPQRSASRIAVRSFERDFEGQPTEAEVAEGTGLDIREVRKARAALVARSGIVRLDAPVNTDSGSLTLLQILVEDPDAVALRGARAWSAERMEILERDVLGRLPERDALLLRSRLSGGTLDDVGQAVGLTRERARQLLLKAAQKARVVLEDIRTEKAYRHRDSKLRQVPALEPARSSTFYQLVGGLPTIPAPSSLERLRFEIETSEPAQSVRQYLNKVFDAMQEHSLSPISVAGALGVPPERLSYHWDVAGHHALETGTKPIFLRKGSLSLSHATTPEARPWLRLPSAGLMAVGPHSQAWIREVFATLTEHQVTTHHFSSFYLGVSRRRVDQWFAELDRPLPPRNRSFYLCFGFPGAPIPSSPAP